MIRILYILFASILLASCDHKELCYDHSHIMEVDVTFDWYETPEASPKSMSLYLFPEDGGRPSRYEFADRYGGRLRIRNGNYRAICFNSDTRNVKILDEASYDSFCISSKSLDDVGGLSALGILSRNQEGSPTPEEEVVVSPDIIWSAAYENVVVNDSNREIRLSPKLSVISGTLEIRNASNLRWINSVSGSLSGMSAGYMPQAGIASESHATYVFGCRYDVDQSAIFGEFTSFGHCPSVDNTHILSIFVTLADDSSWVYSADVSQQIHESDDPYNLKIVLDDLPIPKPVVNGGGFMPEVDEWGKVEIKIDM